VAEAKRPLIYISYGMTKSGSTLAFELTRALMEQNGFRQKRLSQEAVPSEAKINFVHRLSEAQLEAIEREARALGSPIVLKTHVGPTRAAEAWLRAGRIQGHCVFRDPREIALSMLDHGRRARASGDRAFADIETLDDALMGIRRHVSRFVRWAQLPGIIPLYYDDVAFASQDVVRRLSAQTGLAADPAKVERIAKHEQFTQYNKGVPGRAKEMSPEDSARVTGQFPDFYAAFIDPRRASAGTAPAPAPVRPGPPRLLGLPPPGAIWRRIRGRL
jgi:hypothetical protein